ncbi:Conserved_hypothetical protein [Hexamita inflata]|uniref:Uncharacterized protein n=1 Tax=Hexamita inflata TaxID=28002 RepID=A0AA86NUK0_9EUKA|nr:Conserved hypothetical protein [Hexamita inflata]
MSMQASTQDLDEYNPFAENVDPTKLKQTQKQIQEERQDFYSLKIADKTAFQQSKVQHTRTAEIKQENKILFKSSKNVQPSEYPITVPQTLQSSRREGIKHYIDRQKEICRVVYNTAMKQVEIEQLHKILQRKHDELNVQELKLNKELRQIEIAGREQDEKSLIDNKLGEEAQHRLDETHRKVDELKVCAQTIFQEIARQTEILQYNVRCRDMIYQVASHSVQADYVQEYNNRHNIIEKFFTNNVIALQQQQEPSNEQATPNQKPEQNKKQNTLKQLPQKLQTLTQPTQKVQQDQYAFLILPEIIELSKQLTGLKIEFDFNKFVSQINKNLKLDFGIKVPLSTKPSRLAQADNKSGQPVEYESINKKIEQPPLPVLKCVDQNIFERVDVSKPELILPSLLKSLMLLRKTYDIPQIPFKSDDEFINNLELLEESNLTKTQQLQDISQKIEETTTQFTKIDKDCASQEQTLLDQIDSVKQRIYALQQRINRQFDKEQIADTIDAFIYNLDDFKSLEDLTIEKISFELELTHQAIAQAGLFCEAITMDGTNMSSDTILSNMEQILISRLADLSFVSETKFFEVRRALGKIRREMVRKSKDYELMEAANRSKKRQEEREERAKKIVPVQKQCFVRSYVGGQKKTVKQLELEEKLKQKERLAEDGQRDFYAE